MTVAHLVPHSPDIEILHAASRQDWLAMRRADVTASAIGTLVGVHPYCSPFELWAEKTGKLAFEDEAADSPAMRRGRYLERVAIDLCAEAMPTVAFTQPPPFTYFREPAARIGATPDLFAHCPHRGRGVIQIKSIEPSIFRREWMVHSGAIEPPLWIGCQALVEARLTGSTWAAIAALRVGHGIDFDLIDVPLHPGAWARLRAAVADFWRRVAAGDPLPPDYGRDGKLIAEVWRHSTAGAVVDLSHDNALCDALATRERLRNLVGEMDADVKRIDALIRHKAGDAETVLAGDYRVTLRDEHVKEYTVSARTRRPIRVRHLRKGETHLSREEHSAP